MRLATHSLFLPHCSQRNMSRGIEDNRDMDTTPIIKHAEAEAQTEAWGYNSKQSKSKKKKKKKVA